MTEKEFVVLGKDFIKYLQDSANGYEISKIHEFGDGELEDIANHAINNGKVIFIYDKHLPKGEREIVGEVSEIRYDNNTIKMIPKWNELGTKILESETRYPSVELVPRVEDTSKYQMYAIAMVGEPSSTEVDKLELSSTEIIEEANEGGLKMDEQIKEIIEAGKADPEKMRQGLTTLIGDDPTLMALVIDAFADALLEQGTAEPAEEETDEEEVVETEQLQQTETPAEPKKEDKEKDVEKKAEELSATILNYGYKFGLGLPRFESMADAIKDYTQNLNKKMSEAKRKESAFAKILWENPVKEVKAEDLGATEVEKTTSFGRSIYNGIMGR